MKSTFSRGGSWSANPVPAGVAFVQDAEYEELMARKAGLPRTRFGDGYEPKHVERIERLTRRLQPGDIKKEAPGLV